MAFSRGGSDEPRVREQYGAIGASGEHPYGAVPNRGNKLAWRQICTIPYITMNHVSDSIAMQNRLLRAVPLEQYERWKPHLELVELPLGHSVYESGDRQTHVYFPLTAIVSLLYVMKNGASAEIAVVGNDGVVGISLFMGGNSTSSRAVVQSAGSALQLPASELLNESARAGPVLTLLLRYTQALITQMSQTAVCNRHHSLHQQLCRWLLLSHDRLPGDQLNMTQELIGNMLGVRRAGVTVEARKLQETGAISYHRGRIKILDRAQLEALTCECYDVVKREADRLSQLEYTHSRGTSVR